MRKFEFVQIEHIFEVDTMRKYPYFSVYTLRTADAAVALTYVSWFNLFVFFWVSQLCFQIQIIPVLFRGKWHSGVNFQKIDQTTEDDCPKS